MRCRLDSGVTTPWFSAVSCNCIWMSSRFLCKHKTMRQQSWICRLNATVLKVLMNYNSYHKWFLNPWTHIINGSWILKCKMNTWRPSDSYVHRKQSDFFVHLKGILTSNPTNLVIGHTNARKEVYLTFNDVQHSLFKEDHCSHQSWLFLNSPLWALHSLEYQWTS